MALGTLAVGMPACTGAWSHVPVAAGSGGVTATVMVGVLPELPDEQASVPGAEELDPDPPGPELDGQVATAPTNEMTPGVVWLLGRVMVTLSPTATAVCCDASKASCTWRVVEVACIAVWPVWALPPSSADTVVTRTVVGSNTAC